MPKKKLLPNLKTMDVFLCKDFVLGKQKNVSFLMTKRGINEEKQPYEKWCSLIVVEDLCIH